MTSLDIHPGALGLATLRSLWAQPARLVLDPAARPAIVASAEAVARVVAAGRGA